MKARTPKRLRW